MGWFSYEALPIATSLNTCTVYKQRFYLAAKMYPCKDAAIANVPNLPSILDN